MTTTSQQQYIRLLIRKAELDETTITFQYRGIGVEEKWMGEPVSKWIGSLSTADASRVINKLRDLVGEDEDDEDDDD